MSEKDARLFQFPHVLIVEASAGSGKTYALAKRYTQLLINPYLKPEEIPLNTILAITFTNKAVGEMKERILEFLKKIALDKFSKHKEKADILSSLGVKEELARKKAYRIMDELIRNYNFFQVQTIDSFINAILSGCAFKLNLSANFRTKEEYDEYLAYSLDKLIDKAAADDDIRALFGDFLRHYLFIEKRTGWFPKQNILGILNSLFSKSNRYAGRFLPNDIEAKDLLSRKKGILKTMAQLAANLPPGVNKIFSNKLSDFLSENEDTFDVDDLSIFFKNKDFPINKGSALSKEIEKLWANIRKNIGQLCEAESASLFNYYIDIFNNVLADLKAVSSKDDVLFLEALNKEAAGLFLEGSLTLPELYWRLATRFKHFLIDEFQDTSRLQWENLFMMIQEALSIDGSLFYVGDRKQAIYRFRGGEVSLIDSVKGRFANLIEQALAVNYRSRREIVEFNNRIFSKENISRFLKEKQTLTKSGAQLDVSDKERIAEVFEGSRQTAIEDKPGGYVKAEFIDCKLKDERDRLIKDKVLKLIEDLSRRYPFKEIAILARKNDQVELLTSWLLEKNIPVESEKTLNIRQNSYIKELVSFLKFLSSPIDNLSFASFILGDIFAKASGLDAKKMQDFIFRHKPKGDQPAYLYREFRLEFPKVWDELVEEFFKSVGFVPLYELIISIFGRFKVMKNFYAYQGFFMRFLELIKEQEEDSPDISSFLEFFDEAAEDDLYVNVTESDSVKITTIHKAKGAEFRAVIVPFTEMNVRTESPVVISDADRDTLRLMHIKKTYADFSPTLERIYREEYIKSFIDELNGIYVAFTRAIDELYIFVSPRTRTGINLAAMLLPDRKSVV